MLELLTGKMVLGLKLILSLKYLVIKECGQRLLKMTGIKNEVDFRFFIM